MSLLVDSSGLPSDVESLLPSGCVRLPALRRIDSIRSGLLADNSLAIRWPLKKTWFEYENIFFVWSYVCNKVSKPTSPPSCPPKFVTKFAILSRNKRLFNSFQI